MKKVRVEVSSGYDVFIDRGIINRIGSEAKKIVTPGKAAIISGDEVFPVYGERVSDSLKKNGFSVFHFIHRSGEEAKSLNVYGQILDFLSQNYFSRTDTIFALGGGVTGDLAGFAAATYCRGINFFQIPTTLLADVDSSVGGKNGINLDNAKNQIGCFYQPLAVFCDPDTLVTLSPEQYRCGCAEIIKYGILGDSVLFSEIENKNISDQEEHIISRCVEMKRDIIQRDEYDTGERRLLNLGHTFGHAVEKCSKFSLTHGDAVAVGTAKIMRSAVRHGICSEDDCSRVIRLLKKYGLPTDCSYTDEELYNVCLSDKKISDGHLHIVVPETIGKCRIIPIDLNDLKNWM